MARRFVFAVVLAMLVVVPAAASAYTAAPGYQASDYVTGFPSAKCCDWGPIGIAFDASDNLYVGDNVAGHVYRFQPGGGTASAATRLTAAPLAGDIKGLAIARDGRIYLARYEAGDVVELSAATGAIARTVVSGIPCATGLAVDPLSGDLFVSQNVCASTIWRVSGVAGGTGTASRYATGLGGVDGITFGPDGALYAVSGDTAVQIDGTDSRTPGAYHSLARVPHADGIAVGPPTSAADKPFIVVNSTDGTVTRVDFSRTPPVKTPVLSGGSRGDFAAVDSRGCLYATQSTSIVRITPKGRRCDLAPTTPGVGKSSGAGDSKSGGRTASPGITVDVIRPHPPRPGTRCRQLSKVVLRVRQHGNVRLRWIRVYVGDRRVRILRKRSVTSKIVLRDLPRGRFTVKLVARTTKGRTLTKKQRFHSC